MEKCVVSERKTEGDLWNRVQSKEVILKHNYSTQKHFQFTDFLKSATSIFHIGHLADI